MCTWVLLKSIRFQDGVAWTHKKNLETSAQGWYDLIDSDLSFYRRKGTDHFGPHFFMGCLFATWHAPHLLSNTTPTSALWHHIFQQPPLVPTWLLQVVRFAFHHSTYPSLCVQALWPIATLAFTLSASSALEGDLQHFLWNDRGEYNSFLEKLFFFYYIFFDFGVVGLIPFVVICM